MVLNIEIDDRTYNDIESFCLANNMEIQKYLLDIIEEKHSINKFGDLNEIIPKAIEENTVEVKKRGRPKKSIETAVSETQVTEEQLSEVKEEETKKIAEIPKTEKKEEIVKPTVKRKRTLKAL